MSAELSVRALRSHVMKSEKATYPRHEQTKGQTKLFKVAVAE